MIKNLQGHLADSRAEIETLKANFLDMESEVERLQDLVAQSFQDKGAQKEEQHEDNESQSQVCSQAGGDSMQAEMLSKLLMEAKGRNKEAEKIVFQSFPTGPKFRAWWLAFRKKVASSSGQPLKAFEWINQVDSATSIEELEDDHEFETLSAKITSALTDICHGEFLRKMNVLEEELAKKNKMLGGRVFAWHIKQHFRVSEVEGSILRFEDLLAVELIGDNVVAFDNDWDYVISGLKKVPDDETLEALYKKQLDKSVQLKDKLALYEQGIALDGKSESYQELKRLVTAHIEQRRRKKNRDAMGAKGKAAAAKAVKTKAKAKAAAGDCRQFLKHGSCSRGEDCPYNHDPNKAPAKKSRSQSRGRSPGGGGPPASRRPSRGKSPSGKQDAKPCFKYLQGKCTNGAKCDFWHPPVCIHFKKGNCDAGKKCVFLHPQDKATPASSEDEAQKAAKKEAKAKKKAEKAAAKAQAGKDGDGFVAMPPPAVRSPGGFLGKMMCLTAAISSAFRLEATPSSAQMSSYGIMGSKHVDLNTIVEIDAQHNTSFVDQYLQGVRNCFMAGSDLKS